MWQDNKEVLSPSEKEKMEEMQSKMEIVLDNALGHFDDEGVCFFVLYGGEVGLRMANISNVKTKYLVAALKEWLKIQESHDDRDRPS